MPSTRDHDMRLLGKLIRDIGIAMLTTRARDGRYVSRPVATQATEFDGDLWFFASAASHKVAEIKAHPQVNVSYASNGKNTYVSVSGRASVRRDRKRIDALWSKAAGVYFPGGKDDPDVTLIRVRVETAEYWDGPGTLVGKALRFALAAVVENADVMGDNRTLRIARGGRSAKVVHGNTRGDAARVQATHKRTRPGSGGKR